MVDRVRLGPDSVSEVGEPDAGRPKEPSRIHDGDGAARNTRPVEHRVNPTGDGVLPFGAHHHGRRAGKVIPPLVPSESGTVLDIPRPGRSRASRAAQSGDR